MKFSLVAEEFREETLGSLAFREREKGSRVERIEGRGGLGSIVGSARRS